MHRPSSDTPKIPLAVALATLVLSAAVARPQSQVDDTVRKVRALQREIAALLDSLPPAQRAEVERRLAAAEATATAAHEADAPSDDTAKVAENDTGAGVRADAGEGPSAAPRPTPPSEPVTGSTSRAESTADPVLPSRPRCRAVALLDTNGDDQVTGADRYWRHLYLAVEGESEPVSLFDLGIRGVSVGLDAYTTDEDFVGDVDLDGEAVFRLIARRRGPSRGSLVIDSDGLRRAEGPRLVDAEGEPLSGIQRVVVGQSLVDADGVAHPIACDPAPPR